MILTVTFNPSLDKTLFVDDLTAGDTNRIRRDETDAGGKGINLSRIAAELGAPTVATGFLGGSAAPLIRHVMAEEGVADAMISVAGETRTNFSVESLNREVPPTTLNAPGPTISSEELGAFWASFDELLLQASWVAAGGSLPPGVDPGSYAEIVRRARRAGVPVLIDADGEPMKLALAEGPDLIKPNGAEAGRLVGFAVSSREDAVRAARGLVVELGRVNSGAVVIISLGADGAVLATSEGVWFGESPDVEARSTIGAGDSLLGGVLAKRLEGLDWAESLRWGLAAGAATATTNGAEIGRLPVIESLLPAARVSPVG